jgi:hypothetical protein
MGKALGIDPKVMQCKPERSEMKLKQQAFSNWRRATLMAGALAALSLNGAQFVKPAMAQGEDAQALAKRSSIVVEGKVVRLKASLEPLLAASSRTVVISISRMHSGAGIAGDLTGRQATVILSDQAKPMKLGAEAVFFGNPRFIGQTLTIADEGELPAAAAAAVVTANVGVTREDEALRERIAAATNVFRGKVEGERALAAGTEADETRELASEHDPEWHVATVKVLTALKGAAKEGDTVSVIFPASRDIMWFNTPKLKPGEEAIFLAHPPSQEGARLTEAPGVKSFLDKQPAVVVSQPFDAVPASDEARVRNLLQEK